MDTENHVEFDDDAGTAQDQPGPVALSADLPRRTGRGENNRRLTGALVAVSLIAVGAVVLGASAAGPRIAPPESQISPGVDTSPVAARPHGRQDFTDWTMARSRDGIVELRPSAVHPSARSFYIAGNVASTAWVASPPLDVHPPYRVSFWVHVSADRYNGFSIYDAIDVRRGPTDMRVYLHDDRGDRTAQGGWHGALWVKDAVGRYSVSPVPRNQWVKFALQRRRDNSVTLFMNDRPVGNFVSRSALPLGGIERIGDINRQWWHGVASWGPVEIASR